MHGPPLDPRYLPTPDRTDPRDVLSGYVVMAGFLLGLWIASHPLVGGAVLATALVLGVGTRRASRLVRCFHRRGGFSYELLGRVRVTVTRPGIDEAR